MNDIDVFGFKFIWISDNTNQCSLCDLKKSGRNCPDKCIKNGYYKILGGEDLRYYEIHKWIQDNKPNFGKRK